MCRFGHIGDSRGRRVTLLWSILCVSVSACTQGCCDCSAAVSAHMLRSWVGVVFSPTAVPLATVASTLTNHGLKLACHLSVTYFTSSVISWSTWTSCLPYSCGCWLFQPPTILNTYPVHLSRVCVLNCCVTRACASALANIHWSQITTWSACYTCTTQQRSAAGV